MADSLVGVVLLSWNGRDETLAALASLAGSTYPALAPIVVDNGSSDGVADAVAAAFPEAELIRSEVNLGFAGGSNLGIERALARGASHVLLLNNDTEIDPGCVAALVAESGRHADAGALCAKMLFYDPPDLVWYAGASFDPKAGYNGRQRGYRERDDGRYDTLVETERACGAAMLVPRAAFEQVGLFDADLFAYAEDTDWSLRVREAGYRIYVVPRGKVWHKVSFASGGESSPATLYYDTRNTIEVCQRHAPLGPLAGARRRALIVAAHLAQALRSNRRREGVAAVFEGYRDQRAGRLGQRSPR